MPNAQSSQHDCGPWGKSQQRYEDGCKADGTPSVDDLVGIDPDWTGPLTTEEYIANQRGSSPSALPAKGDSR